MSADGGQTVVVGPTPIPQPESRGRGIRNAAQEAAGRAWNEPDVEDFDSDDELEDDYEPDMSDGFADGWEGDESDPSSPIDDDQEAPVSFLGRSRPVVEFFKDAQRELAWRVAARPSSTQAQSSQLGSQPQLFGSRLERLAAFLIENQAPAIAATGPSEAYRLLRPMTQEYTAGRVTPENRSDSWVSKGRDQLILCPWGTVPLQFFAWGITHDKVRVYQSLLDLLYERFVSHRPAKFNQSEYARLAVTMASQEKEDIAVHVSDGSVRKLVPIAWELVSRQRFRLAALRGSWESWHDDAILPDANRDDAPELHQLDNPLNDLFKDRGVEMYRFAIAGWQPAAGDKWFLCL